MSSYPWHFCVGLNTLAAPGQATVRMELTATALPQMLTKENRLSRVVFWALLLQISMANRLRHK